MYGTQKLGFLNKIGTRCAWYMLSISLEKREKKFIRADNIAFFGAFHQTD